MVNWSPNLQTAVSDLVCDVSYLKLCCLITFFYFFLESNCLVLNRK